MTERLAARFLVDVTQTADRGLLASETFDQMIRLNLFRFLSAKKCSSVCPEKIPFKW